MQDGYGCPSGSVALGNILGAFIWKCASNVKRLECSSRTSGQFGVKREVRMKPMLSVFTLTLAGAAFMLPALAADEHTVLTPKDMKWAPGPPSLPKGAEVAL